MAMETQVDKKDDEKEWGVRARMISRENTISRRFSYSYVSSFREDHPNKSFTISSTASSPGFSLKEEIDPSTYSFTNALKALQMRSINTWEYVSAERFELNSKWNEAERYICNPLSGEVPMECLSSKTLMNNNGRSFRNRITMSAPLIHHSSRFFTHQPSLNLSNVHPIQDENETEVKEKERESIKRDVGIQSSPSPTSTPSIKERSINCNVDSSQTSISSSDSNSNLNSNLNLSSNLNMNSKSKSKSGDQAEDKEVVGAKEEETKKDDEDDGIESKKSKTYVCMCKKGSGCLFLKNLWSRKNHKKRTKNLTLNDHFKGCSN